MTQLGVAYFGNRLMSHAREDIAKIAACSDYVIHTVSESDLVFHKAVLARLFAESRRAGLEVWVDPWSLGGVFGGEAFSKFLAEHRDSWQTMSDGRVVPLACMNRPEWRSFVKEWILTVRDMGAQVIFWDEPHPQFDFESEWAGIYSCVCTACQGLFKKKHGSTMPSRLDERAREFRRDTMKNFLDEVMSFSHARNLKNALCLYAFKGYPEYDRIWEAAAALKDLDIFGCDPYWRWHGRKWDPDTRVGEFSRYVVEHAKKNGKGSQIWIQAMRLPAGAEPEITRAIRAAAEAGVSHIAAWSYDGGELLDPVLSERPEVVWKTVVDAFNEIRSKR